MGEGLPVPHTLGYDTALPVGSSLDLPTRVQLLVPDYPSDDQLLAIS